MFVTYQLPFFNRQQQTDDLQRLISDFVLIEDFDEPYSTFLMDVDGFSLGTISEKSTSNIGTPSCSVSSSSLHTDHAGNGLFNGHSSKLEVTLSRGFEITRPDQPNVEQPSPQDRSNTELSDSPRLSNTASSEPSARDQHSILTVDPSDDGSVDELERQNPTEPNGVPVDPDAMTSSTTSGGATSVDQDMIEVHQFSVADIDAYLDIYFDALNNRLRYLIGTGEELEQFRSAMKNRIISHPNARERKNVLLGKMHEEVVAAVLLTFSTETCTISNEQLSRQSHTCLTSLYRWMAAKANYHPADAGECYIEMIGVESSHRSRGIGSAMLECAENFAQQAGARLLTIHAGGDLEKGFFQRSGFEFDRADNSAWWKSFVEKQGIQKMIKTISSNENNALNDMQSYVNGSMVDSLDR